MTTSRLALVVANVLGIVAGISGGYLMRRSKATTHVGRRRFGGTSGTTGASLPLCDERDRVESNSDWAISSLLVLRVGPYR